MSAGLTVQGLSVGWPGRRAVLSNLSFALRGGERVALVGPNGAGKSSLFHTIAGVLAPQAGTMRLAGDVLRPGRFDPRIALVFQQAEDQLFCPTLAEDVAYGARNMGLPAAQVQARTTRALAQCGLTGLEDRPIHHLSGGEKRRASIAGALVMAPQVLLLDEPSGGLDLRNRRRLIGLLAGLDAAMLIASHDLELVLELCPRVLLIDQGGIRADGPAPQVLGDANLMAAHGQEVPASLQRNTGPRLRAG